MGRNLAFPAELPYAPALVRAGVIPGGPAVQDL